MCARSKFFRENVRFFYTFPLQENFSQIFLFFKKLSKHFFLFKDFLPYKILFKTPLFTTFLLFKSKFLLFLELRAAPRCVKNLTYVWYLINLYQIPSLFTALNKLSTHYCLPRPIIYPILSPLFFSNINNFPYKTLNSPYLYPNSLL